MILSGLNSHIFFSHERKVTDLGCPFCGKEFTMKQDLKDHVATDHKEKSINVQNVRPHTCHVFHY